MSLFDRNNPSIDKDELTVVDSFERPEPATSGRAQEDHLTLLQEILLARKAMEEQRDSDLDPDLDPDLEENPEVDVTWEGRQLSPEYAQEIFEEARSVFTARATVVLLRAYGVMCGVEDVGRWFESIGKPDAGFDPRGRSKILKMMEDLVSCLVFDIVTDNLKVDDRENLKSRFTALIFPVTPHDPSRK